MGLFIVEKMIGQKLGNFQNPQSSNKVRAHRDDVQVYENGLRERIMFWLYTGTEEMIRAFLKLSSDPTK